MNAPSLLHVPEDMTVTVSADVTLGDLQKSLASSRQWLPLDPPDFSLTLREVLDCDESGPRRYGYGTVRGYVIGLTAKLADGRIVKSGSKVVKNVAGFDLQKLFIGARGTLGTILEVTLKLRPLPETEEFVRQEFGSLEAAGVAIEAVAGSELIPVVFDLHCGRADVSSAVARRARSLVLVLGFDGAREEVEWQLALAKELGFHLPTGLTYDQGFRAEGKTLHKLSVLPSRLIESLRLLDDEPFVARAGNGIIFHKAATSPAARPSTPTLHPLNRRIKDAFDPNHFFPEFSA